MRPTRKGVTTWGSPGRFYCNGVRANPHPVLKKEGALRGKSARHEGMEAWEVTMLWKGQEKFKSNYGFDTQSSRWWGTWTWSCCCTAPGSEMSLSWKVGHNWGVYSVLETGVTEMKKSLPQQTLWGRGKDAYWLLAVSEPLLNRDKAQPTCTGIWGIVPGLGPALRTWCDSKGSYSSAWPHCFVFMGSDASHRWPTYAVRAMPCSSLPSLADASLLPSFFDCQWSWALPRGSWKHL